MLDPGGHPQGRQHLLGLHRQRRALGRGPQFGEHPGVYRAVLADLQLGEVEAERLRLPDEVLHLAVGLPARSRGYQRPLDQAHIGHECVRPRVGEVGVAVTGRLEARRDVEQVGPVGLLRGTGRDVGEQLRVCRGGGIERAAQSRRRWRHGFVQGQRPPDPGGHPLQRAQHVIGLDGGGFPGDPGRHERVAVPVGAHPAAEPQERGHPGRDAAAVRARDRVVHRPVERRNDPKQGLVERGHHRPDLIDRVHGVDPQLCGAPQHVDLLTQLAKRLLVVGGGGTRVVEGVHQHRDTAHGLDHRPAARLGGMGGEHRVHAQPGEQLPDLVIAPVPTNLGHCRPPATPAAGGPPCPAPAGPGCADAPRPGWPGESTR